MSAESVKFIFFDLGWTLINETAVHRKRAHRLIPAIKEQGVTITEDEFFNLCYEVSRCYPKSMILAALTELGIDNENAKQISQSFPYFPFNEAEKLYDGVPEMLEYLSANYPLGVIANQSPGTEARLKYFGLLDYFSAVLASPELGLSKPDLNIFHEAARQASCLSNELCMVGDRLDNDIRPANQLGWTTVRMLKGFARTQKPRDDLDNPDLTVEDITQLKEHF